MTAFRDKTMQCPRCGKDLVRYEDRDKWRCKACLGALVGADQLVVEIGDRARDVIAGAADPSRPAIHPCPACAFPMTPYTIATVELDRCVDDALVWFDGGEIGKAREALPVEEPPELLVDTLAFLRQLRAEPPVEIPPAEPLVVTSGEWQARRLCPDGACTGVIGNDGRCHVCGKSLTEMSGPGA